jgi:hypothetical protein
MAPNSLVPSDCQTDHGTPNRTDDLASHLGRFIPRGWFRAGRGQLFWGRPRAAGGYRSSRKVHPGDGRGRLAGADRGCPAARSSARGRWFQRHAVRIDPVSRVSIRHRPWPGKPRPAYRDCLTRWAGRDEALGRRQGFSRSVPRIWAHHEIVAVARVGSFRSISPQR